MFGNDNGGELDRNNLPIKNKSIADIFQVQRTPSRVPYDVLDTQYRDTNFDASEERFQFGIDQNQEAIRAGYQSSAELWGKAITQGVSEAALGTMEGIGYLMDFEQHKNIIQGTETEYGNWFSDVMKKSKEYVNEEMVPVYKTEAAQQGFAPSDGSWWASNAPSIASAVSLMIPAMGATKIASYAGKAARALGTSAGIASKVDKASDIVNATNKLLYGRTAGQVTEGITQAVFSRYMENTMEASGTYDEYYQKAIAAGKDPQLAAKEAGEAASTAWKNNWGNIVFDIGQYMSLTKGLNATNQASKAFRKNLLQKTGLFAGNMAQEGIEEGFQFVVSKEAQRKAEMGNDYEGWKDITKRIEDYSDDPEFKTSILLGAVGGGAFTAVGKGIEGISNKIAKNAQRDVVKQKAIDEGDIVTAHKITNEQFTEHAFNQAKEGKLQDTMDTYRKMGESTDEELASKWQMTPEQIKDFRERNPEIQEDLKFYQEKFLELSDDVRKDPALLKTELALNFQNRANDKLRQKLAKEESELRSKIGTKLTSEQLQKKILTNKLNSLIATDKIIDRKAFSKLSYGKGTLEYLDKQIKDTKEELEKLKDVEVKATSEDSEINKHTEQVSNLEAQDAINGIRLEKMQTEEGQKETKDDIMSGFRNQFLATVSEDASLDTLTKAVDTPVFGKDAQSKIDKLAKAANEGATVPSEGTIEEDVRDRYSNSILLFHDLQEMHKNKGISSSNVKDVETFIKEYRSNSKFRDAFNEYFNTLSANAVERQMEDVLSPVDNTNEVAAHSEYMDAMPEDVGHGFKADRSIVQNHQYMMYIRKGDDITYFGKKDPKSKKSTIELAYAEGYSNLIDDGKIHMLYDEYGDPVLTETNTRTIIDEEGNKQEIVFLTDDDFKVINDPTINLFGEKISFEVPLDDTYSPTQGKGAEEMVIIPFIEYEGRKVQLGKLRATTKNDGGENIEIIRELRNRIHTEWLQSEVKEGSYIVQKDFGITVGGRTPGHFNITGNGRNKISQVTDTYYLGVLNTKKGKTLIMDNDGASNFGIDKDTQVTHGDLSGWSAMGGKTVLHILTTAGKYVPIGLYTSKLKEQPKAQIEVFKFIDRMFSDKQLQESHIDSDYTKEYIQKLNSNLQEFLSLKISYMPGVFHTISLSGDVDSKKTYHTAQEMKEGFSELIMRINESKLNSNDTYKNGKTYNQYIIDEGWITTNLSPDKTRNTLGAMVKLDLRNFNEGKLPTVKPKRERATLLKKEKVITPVVIETEEVTSIKEGVDAVFQENIELTSIGTQEQYSQYLDTIFPDSKVKNIVYHGSPNFFEKFDKSKLGTYTGAASAKEGIFFGGSVDVSKSYLDKRGQTLKVNDLIEQKYGKDVSDKLKQGYNYLASGLVDKVLGYEPERITPEKIVFDTGEVFEDGDYGIKLKDGSILYDSGNYNGNNQNAVFLANIIKRINHLSDTFDDNYGGYIDKDRNITDSPFENLFIRPYILSISNPYVVSDEGNEYRNETYFNRIKKAKEENKDGVVIKDTYDSKFQTKPENVYVVFEPEQIHILGSKQDIEGFKRFVNKEVIIEVKALPIEVTFETSPSDVTESVIEPTETVIDENTPSAQPLFERRGGRRSRSREATEKEYQVWDREVEVAWFKKNYPNIPVSILDDLKGIVDNGGVDLWGLFTNSSIYIATEAKTGTMYHEAFHAVFHILLNENERSILLKEFDGNGIIDKEENMADYFMEYKLTDGIEKKGLSAKVVDFFKRLYHLIQIAAERVGLKKDATIHDLMYRIDKGLYNKFTPNVTFRKNVTRFSVAHETNGLTPREEVMAINTINGVLIRDIVPMVAEKTLGLKIGTPVDEVIREYFSKDKKNNTLERLYVEAFYKIDEDLYTLQNTEGSSKEAKEYLLKLLDKFAYEKIDGSLIFSSLLPRAAQDLSVRFGLGISVDRIVSNEDVTIDEIASDEGVIEGWMVDMFKDHYSKFSERAKMAFAMVQKGEDIAGYPIYESPIRVYQKLANTLANSLDEGEMLNNLEILAEMFPHYETVVDMVVKDSKFRVEMWRNMGNKHYVEMLGQTAEKSYEGGTQDINVKSFVINRKALSENIREEWQDEFYSSKMFNNSTLEVNVPDTYMSDLEGLIVDFNRLNVKEALPTELVDRLFDIMKGINMPVNRDTLSVVFPNKAEKSDFGKFIKADGLRSVVKTLTDGNDPFFGEHAQWKKLDNMATIIANGREDTVTASFRSSDGKTINSIVDNRFMLDLINRLTATGDVFRDNMRDLTITSYQKTPFYKNSPFLKEFRTVNNLKNIRMAYMQSFDTEGKESVLEYANMTKQQIEAFQINHWFNYEGKEVNKEWGYYMIPPLSDSTKAAFIRFRKESEIIIREKLVQTAIQERDRIEWLQKRIKNKDTKDIPYNLLTNGLQYQIFKGLNDQSFKDENAFKRAVNTLIDGYIKDETNKLFSEEVIRKETDKNGNVTFLDNTGMMGKKELKVLRENMSEYLVNRMYMNIQTVFTFAGDVAQYKPKKEEKVATGFVDFTDLYKRLKEIHSPQNKISVDTNNKYYLKDGSSIEVRPTFKVLYVNDPTNINPIVTAHMPLLKQLFPNESEAWILEKYGKLNNTDAATYVDLYRMREIYLGTATWTDELQAQYDELIVGRPPKNPKGAIMQSVKPFYFNHRFITGSNKDIHIAATQLKNSEQLLTPQMAKGNPKLMMILEKMGYTFNDDGSVDFNTDNRLVDTVMFNSAVKVGEFNTVNDISELTVDNDVTHELFNADYSIQQETPEHYRDSDIIYGTQLRKLIMLDLDKTRDYYVNGEWISGDKLFKQYQEAIDTNVREAFNELKKLFYKEDGSADIESIVKVLRKEVIEKQLGEDMLSALDWLDGNKTETVLPLWDPHIVYEMEAILSSYFKNNITKQKAFGVSLINATSYGFEKINEAGLRKPEIIVEYDANGDPFIKEVEVLMPAQSRALYDHYIGKDGYLDVSKVPDALKMGIFYRIPTEGKHSMFHIKVIGYLEGVGGQIIMPDEVTTIAGLDFDVDKLFGLMYNFNETKEGLVKVPSGMESKESRDNLLIDLMYGVMSNPSTIKKQLTPNSYKTLEDAKEKVFELMGVDEIDLNVIFPSAIREVFERNMTGQALIGQGANQNTSHALFTEGNFRFKDFISFNGKNLKEMSRQKDDDGRYISSALNQFLAAYVDNAKDPMASFLNITTTTSDLIATMIRVGHDPYAVLLLVASPAARKFSVEIAKTNKTKADINKVLTKLEESTKAHIKGLYGSKVFEDFEGVGTDERVTLENIEETYEEGDSIDVLKTNFSIYQLLKSTFEKTQSLTIAMNAMKFDAVSKAAGPEYANIIVAKRAWKKAIEEEDKGKLLGFKEFIASKKIPYVQSFYKYGIEMPSNETPQEVVEQPINKEIVTKTYDKKWKDGSNTNKATSFALKNKPNEIFELVNDKEEEFYSLHIKTTSKDSLTESEKQQLVKAVTNSIPIGGKLSSWGEVTKGGLSGLNRFKSEGFVEVGNRKVSDNQTIPILEKKPINKEIKPKIELELKSNFGKNLFNFEVMEGGKPLGYVGISLNKNKILQITGIELKERGFGKQVYFKLQEQYPEYTIKSDPKNLSEDAVNMWDSLVKRNLATKNADKDYTLLTQEQPIVEETKAISATKNIIADIADLPYEKPLFNKIIERFAQYKRMGELNAEEISYISRLIMTALSTGYRTFSHDEMKRVISETPSNLANYKKKNPEGPFSVLLEQFTKRTDHAKKKNRIPFPYLHFNRKGLDDIHKASMTSTWKRMMFSPVKEERDLAMDLAKYAFYSTGYTFRHNSFSDVVPVAFTSKLHDSEEEISYREYQKGMFNANFTNDAIKGIFDEIVRNSFRTLKSVPFFDHRADKEISVREVDGRKQILIPSKYVSIKAVNPFEIGEDIVDISDINAYIEYDEEVKDNFVQHIKVPIKMGGKMSTELFTLSIDNTGRVEMDNNNRIVFKYTPKLGVHNQFLEFDITKLSTRIRSIFPTMKVDMEEKDVIDETLDPQERIETLKEVSRFISQIKDPNVNNIKKSGIAALLRQSLKIQEMTIEAISGLHQEAIELSEDDPLMKDLVEMKPNESAEIVKLCNL